MRLLKDEPVVVMVFPVAVAEKVTVLVPGLKVPTSVQLPPTLTGLAGAKVWLAGI